MLSIEAPQVPRFLEKPRKKPKFQILQETSWYLLSQLATQRVTVGLMNAKRTIMSTLSI